MPGRAGDNDRAEINPLHTAGTVSRYRVGMVSERIGNYRASFRFSDEGTRA